MANMGINLSKLQKQINIAFKNVSDEAAVKVLRGVMIDTYKHVLLETPQWSGHMAANLTISTTSNPGSPATSALYKDNWSKNEDPKSKGDPTAVSIANSRNVWFNNAKLSIHERVNLSYRGDKGYYDMIEEGKTSMHGVDLRRVNLPGRAMYRARSRMQTNYRSKFARELIAMERIE